MSLTLDDVSRIANLARLELQPAESQALLGNRHERSVGIGEQQALEFLLGCELERRKVER